MLKIYGKKRRAEKSECQERNHSRKISNKILCHLASFKNRGDEGNNLDPPQIKLGVARLVCIHTLVFF